MLVLGAVFRFALERGLRVLTGAPVRVPVASAAGTC